MLTTDTKDGGYGGISHTIREREKRGERPCGKMEDKGRTGTHRLTALFSRPQQQGVLSNGGHANLDTEA